MKRLSQKPQDTKTAARQGLDMGGMTDLIIPTTVPYNTSDIQTVLGFTMNGIRPEGRCPVCGKTFKILKGKGFFCPDHLTIPTRFTIDFYYKGDRIRRGTTFDGKGLKTFADAHSLLLQARNEINSKRLDPTKWKSKERLDFNVSRLLDKWYKEKETLMKQKKLAPSYVSKLYSYIKNYFHDYFHETDIREIFSVKDFAKQLPGRLSLKYEKNILGALENFFRWAKDEERLIETMPVFPKIEVPEYQPKTIKADIQNKILEFVPEEHKSIFTFLFYQGCRPSEARALKWDAIEDDVVTYKRTWSNSDLRETTKTKRIRQNVLFHEVMSVLPKRGFPLDFVLIHGKEIKRPYSKTFLQSIFNKALGEFNGHYNLDLNISLYEATKYSFGTQLINQGVSIHLLKEWFGHTSIKMTEKYAKIRVIDAFRKIREMRTVSKQSVITKGSLEQ